jgi:hypothetical protein
MIIKLHLNLYIYTYISIFELVKNLVEFDAMGNLIGKNKKLEPQNSRNDDKERGGRISSSNLQTQKPLPLPLPQVTSSMSKKPTPNSGQSSNTKKSTNKYALIQDNFTSLEQVCMFLI